MISLESTIGLETVLWPLGTSGGVLKSVWVDASGWCRSSPCSGLFTGGCLPLDVCGGLLVAVADGLCHGLDQAQLRETLPRMKTVDISKL